jgi:hypothetical protein
VAPTIVERCVTCSGNINYGLVEYETPTWHPTTSSNYWLYAKDNLNLSDGQLQKPFYILLQRMTLYIGHLILTK